MKKKKNTDTNESIQRLTISLPKDVHLYFKTVCSATGRQMSKEIEILIRKRTKELEIEAGITRKQT